MSQIEEVLNEHNHSKDLLGATARTHESRMLVAVAIAGVMPPLAHSEDTRVQDVGCSGDCWGYASIGICQKVRVSLEQGGVSEAEIKMRKSRALRTAFHRKKR